MAVLANTILDACIAAIAVDHTATGGAYDLSTGAVVEGVYKFPPGAQVAMVAVSFPSINPDAAIRNLATYGRTMRVEVSMWASSADDPTVRRTAIMALANDVSTAFENALHDVSTPGALVGENIDEVVCDLVTLDGDEQDLATGYGYGLMVVTITYRQARGF